MLTPGQLVVVGTDFSADADAAVERAARWCVRSGARLSVVHVLDESGDMQSLRRADAQRHGLPLEPPELTRALSEGANALRAAHGIEADVELRSGTPYIELCRIAQERRSALLVLGDAGSTGLRRSVFGSVVERVTRVAPCPVLVSRGSPGVNVVIATTDFSDPSVPALRAGASIATAFGARLTFVHCHELSALPSGSVARATSTAVRRALGSSRQEAEQRLAELASALAPDADPVVVDGDPARAIVHFSRERDASLVVVGTRGRTGLARIMLGSVAEDVARYAACSVLVNRLTPS